MRTDSESVKIPFSCKYLFIILGSACVKAACKHVVEIDILMTGQM